MQALAWDIFSYFAFIIIIIGVIYERYRNWLVTSGAAILAAYAMVFLHNKLLTTLQILIVIAGILSLVKISHRFTESIMVALTTGAYIFLFFLNAIVNFWAFIGSLGLLGIAFGLIILPKRYGFLVMAAGGLLLVAYSFVIGAWVFFFLNIFFFLANIRTWKLAYV